MREREDMKMKKKLVLGVCLIMLLMTGCGNKVVCDFCDEEKSGQTATVWGKEVDICDDCLENMQNGFAQ